MSIFVIDASATLATRFADEATNRSFELLNRLKQDDPASLSSNWAVEIINGLLVAVRRKRIGADELAALWERVADLPITVEFGLNRAEALSVLKLSEKHKLTAYDAAYLKLAIRKQLPMATLDVDLKRAAAAENIVIL
jgi:predicted nucleic acid-binding protein